MILGVFLWGHVIKKKVTLATNKRSNDWSRERFTIDDIQKNQRCYQTHGCSCSVNNKDNKAWNGRIQLITQHFDCHAFVNTANSMECRLCRHEENFHCFKHGLRCQSNYILKTTLPQKILPRVSTPYPKWITLVSFHSKNNCVPNKSETNDIILSSILLISLCDFLFGHNVYLQSS